MYMFLCLPKDKNLIVSIFGTVIGLIGSIWMLVLGVLEIFDSKVRIYDL